jgi:GT2 family glycosyltransferase
VLSAEPIKQNLHPWPVAVEPLPPAGSRTSPEPVSWQRGSLGGEKVEVGGKFLTAGGKPFFLRGVTYGPFAPQPDGSEYHTAAVVDRDFARMAASGFNTVRTYTVPPTWLLDTAYSYGLRVFIGVPWEQHVTFLDTKVQRRSIIKRVEQSVAACQRHPAVLGFAVGNEIPAPMVRWYGRGRIERFIHCLYEEAKSADPNALVSYVNYPTTEYLDLSFLDFHAWNVYLETPQTLSRYLARLQNLAGEKPLVLAELGLDSQRNGEPEQAAVLDWQIRTAGESGCAGVIVFSWTDEWFRSGREILDWRFGLTDRDRHAKLALAATTAAFRDFPVAKEETEGPLVSVVVCSYNGSRTLRETLNALGQLDYPRYEVIVVDDGSTDATPEIAREFPVRLVKSENRGLSHARNLGMRAAQGEILVYVDDDAYPDPLWLRYLVQTFRSTRHAAVGGPNICPPTDCETAQCVSHSPGGPNHVLLSDSVAEHIPGCNMAFRRDVLLAMGGFDDRFRIAGDDVDVCWRLHDRGDTIGFHPAAMVWHHSRNTVRGYLRQQYNYGRAEAMLEAKWPSKYNSAGHPRWEGRVYGPGQHEALGTRRAVVYHGIWGTNLFQSLYMRPPGLLRSLPLLPEWYLLIAALALLSLGGVVWEPLRWAIPLLVAAIVPLVGQALAAASRAPKPMSQRGGPTHLRERATIALLHLLQPVMRLRGRLSFGLHPLRRRNGKGKARRVLNLPRPRLHSEWSEQWASIEHRLSDLERRLVTLGGRTRRGGPHDRWDLEIWGGLFGSIRLMMATEEHGGGKQMVRLRSWPTPARWTPLLLSVLMAVAVLSFVEGSAIVGLGLSALVALLLCRTFLDCAASTSMLVHASQPRNDSATESS